ncbi:hypothetical protein RFX70_08445, partial [Acinetobacter baumannii]|nr:hypothetical protein [Acinetobacter baumannii]
QAARVIHPPYLIHSMSFWSKLFGTNPTDDNRSEQGHADETTLHDPSKYAFVDIEVSLKSRKIHDIGALRHDGAIFHQASVNQLTGFLH